jgi:hypothetical protein
MGFGIFDAASGQPDYAGQAAAQEEARQAKIRQGTTSINQAFSGYTPEFYQQRQQAYVDYAMPQLADQYNTAKNQVGFNLANRSLLGSSAGQSQWSDLSKTMSQAKQNISDSGRAQAQQLEKDVNAAKDTQLSNLYQSADPASAAAGATATAASFSQPSTFQAISNQFSGLLNQYYTSQLINAYRPMSYIATPPMNSDSGATMGTTLSRGNN